MNKKNLILLIILLVLAAGAYFYQVPYQQQLAAKQATGNFLAPLANSAIDKIKINSAKRQVTLVKKSNAWGVEGTGDFAVAPDLSQQLNQTLSELASSTISIASLQSETKANFGLSPDLATTLVLGQGEEKLAELSIGKSEGPYSYFTKANDDKIYASTVDLSIFNAELDYRDHAIFQADPSLWTSLQITQQANEVAGLNLSKKDQSWFADSGKIKLDNNKVAALLNLVSNLQADALPEQKLTGTGLEQPSFSISASSAVLKNSLLIGKAQGDNYYAKKDGSTNIYLISKKKVELLLTNIDELK